MGRVSRKSRRAEMYAFVSLPVSQNPAATFSSRHQARYPIARILASAKSAPQGICMVGLEMTIELLLEVVLVLRGEKVRDAGVERRKRGFGAGVLRNSFLV